MTKEYNAEWYAKNRDKQLAYMRVKMTCDCGKTFNKSSYNKHIMTKVHTVWENTHGPYAKLTPNDSPPKKSRTKSSETSK